MEGIALGTAELLEVLSTYSAAEQPIPAVTASPGWHVVGAFRMPVTFECRFSLIGSVSKSGLTLRARLFDVTAAAPVSGTASTASLVDAYATSPATELEGGHIYQMQVEVTGDEGDDSFGSLKAMHLIAP